MKNKMIISSLVAGTIAIGLVSSSFADFGGGRNFENFETHRTVMDKLIDGENLTSDEQVILEEMKQNRDERDSLRAERQVQREELEPIIEKKRAGEELTLEEQALLDEFRVSGNQGKGNRMGGGRGEGRMGGGKNGGGARNGLGDGTGECICSE